jgi:parallel beta-helix repeat protein
MKRFQTILLFVFVAAAVFIFCIIFQTAHAATVYVGVGETYSTIQSAINAAKAGDTIVVRDGTYDGGGSVNKKLYIKSENGYESTTVIGRFYINANFVTLDGFTIYYATSEMHGNQPGIKLSSASNCVIVNNRCGFSPSAFNYSGINVDWTCNDNVISGNICNYNWDRGIFIGGSNNQCFNNICKYNTFGITVEVGTNITVTGNTCSNNEYWGIYLRESNGVIVFDNTCSNNQNGIYIISSNNNVFYLNKLSNNTISNVFSPNSLNFWHSLVPIYYKNNGAFYRGYMGNYFSDHSLYDSNGDGIGNNNYDLPGTEPDAQYTLATVSDNFDLHAWWLENDNKLYQFAGNQGVGKKTLAGSSSHIWISDEPAKTALTISGSNPWTGQLAFNSAPASSGIMIEIGYSTNGNDFSTGGPEKLMGDGANNILPYTTNSSSFTVPAGKYLAVRVTNYTGISHDLLLGFGVSFASPPGISCTETNFYLDADIDGYGDSGDSAQACTHPDGYVSNSNDCDDNDELEHPGQTWYKDSDGDEYSDGTTNTASCTRPAGYYASSEIISTTDDCDDGNNSINPEASEVCNGSDDNCNDQIDEGVTITYYADTDGDGYGNLGNSTQACTSPSGYVSNSNDCDDSDTLEHPGQTWYSDLDDDGYSDGGTNSSSCTRPANYKITSELIALSGDCDDGDSDEFPNQIWYQDFDGDGYGNTHIPAQSCTKPDGYVTDKTDCDDSDGEIYPGNGCEKSMPWIPLLLLED